MALGLVAFAGCAGRETPRAASEPVGCGRRTVDCLPLHARVLVAADVDGMRGELATRLLLDVVRPSDIEGFRRTFEFVPDVVHSLAYASYEPGELVVVEGGFDAAAVVEHVGLRMNTVELADASPPRRVGFVGPTRIDIAAVGRHRIALAREHGAPMMRLLARTEGRAVPSALERMPADLASRLAGAPLAVVVDATGRLDLETDAGLLFAQTRWVAITATAGSEGRLALEGRTYGPLPSTAEANLRAVLTALSDSEVGGVFGIRDGLPTLQIRTDSGGASIGISLSARSVAHALGLLLERDTRSAVEIGRSETGDFSN